MASKTIQRLLQECTVSGYKPEKKTKGNGFYHQLANVNKVAQNKVSEKYQRTLSPAKLTQYGDCDYDLLIPAIISRRPKEFEVIGEDGDFVIDGQNKEVLFLANTIHDSNAQMHEMILEHPYDSNKTLDQNFKSVLRKEAELFSNLNTMRKKLTKVDELRSDVCQEDKLALQIEEIMKTLNYVTDRFGSTETSATELTSFSQFYYCLTSENDVSEDLSTNRLLSGQKLWNDVYGINSYENSEVNPQEKVHGTAFRAICMIDRFINEALSNETQKNFREWVKTELAKNYTPIKLVKGFGTFTSPRYTLHRVIDKYNDVMENCQKAGKGVTIGPMTIYHAANNVSKDFAHPDEDRWSKIVEAAKKTN